LSVTVTAAAVLQSTTTALNRDRRFSCVSTSSISPSSTPIVVPVPTYLSVAQISQISDIPPRATTKQDRKIARKAKIALVRKQQIASYLSMESSSIPVSRKLPTQSRVHFCVSHSFVTYGQSQSTSCGIRPILRGSDSYRSSASLVTGSPCTLLPMNWGTRCLHQSSICILFQSAHLLLKLLMIWRLSPQPTVIPLRIFEKEI